ncbi:MAG TPA: zf-TFIIB domain-containing protein [bacterium]|nr:zf-TFIIB domain-containing protein [bacterium]
MKNCPHCSAAMSQKDIKGVSTEECPSCGGIWLLKSSFDRIRDREDRFIRWLDLPLWREKKDHALSASARKCPACQKGMHVVDYHGHDVTIDICTSCKGIWLDRDELRKLIIYMEEQVTEETVADFLKDIGHEATQFIGAKKGIVAEVKDMSIIMKLLEYRIFSEFPVLAELASRIPLT